jgi:cobalamin biosynthesis Co2+ chelatase CbiK
MKNNVRIVMLVFLVMIILVCPAEGKEKRGLLIIAHGSPRVEWNKPVLCLEQEVEDILTKQGNSLFHSVKVALMEFSEPSIYTVVKEMEKQGVEEIYALPLFIAPSGHSLQDIPTILGLYSDKKIVSNINEEGIKIVDSKIKITLGPTLNYGDILKQIMLERVKELSTAPETENLIMLAHGSPNFEKNWADLCREIGAYVCGTTGITYFDYAFIEVGQSFFQQGIPVILKAAENGKKTIVIGLYLSLKPDRLLKRISFPIIKGMKSGTKMLEGKNVVFSDKGLLPHKRISQWISARALEWAEQ